MKHIGILGGTFDPVHNGHVDVANLVADKIGCDKVLLVTSARPPHKEFGGLDAELRHELVQAAVAGSPKLEASRIELDMPGLSYTYRTVKEIKSRFSAQFGDDVTIHFIVSAEYLDPAYKSNVTHWQNAQEFLGMVHLVVVPRHLHTAAQARQWARDLNLDNYTILDQPVSDMFSGIVRDALTRGSSLAGLVPARVAELIKLRGIAYR